jgi:hypothetical protein
MVPLITDSQLEVKGKKNSTIQRPLISMLKKLLTFDMVAVF